jgi:hypothetical protein
MQCCINQALHSTWACMLRVTGGILWTGKTYFVLACLTARILIKYLFIRKTIKRITVYVELERARTIGTCYTKSAWEMNYGYCARWMKHTYTLDRLKDLDIHFDLSLWGSPRKILIKDVTGTASRPGYLNTHHHFLIHMNLKWRREECPLITINRGSIAKQKPTPQQLLRCVHDV